MPTMEYKSRSQINPLLQEERDKMSFNLSEMIYFLDDGKTNTDRRREIENLILDDPEFNHPPLDFLSREEEHAYITKLISLCIKKTKEHGLFVPQESLALKSLAVYHKPSGLSVHDVMFMPTLLSQATDEQQTKWLFPAMNYEILGTYAQTEMGHGTYLRGIETTATYDPASQEFVLHSPTVTSIKWWPGGLGKTANFALVAAKLITSGVDHGTHMFIVQLRDLETHMPMPGITVGDIGPKLGFATTDNGFLRLTHVRIPRIHMLMRNAEVLPDGTYQQRRAISDKLTKGTMVMIRAFLVTDVGRLLAGAVTIATRYSAVRLQGEEKNGRETKLLDYRTQQYKLANQIASAYAFLFVGRTMGRLFFSVQSELAAGHVQRLPELHALSSGLKAIACAASAAGIEVCRLACGGHGYSLASGLPQRYAYVTAACTFEGDNTVLLLQTARYLIRCLTNGGSENGTSSTSALPPSVAYITRRPCSPVPLTRVDSLHHLLTAYKNRALGLLQRAGARMDTELAAGQSWDEAFHRCSIALVRTAKAHCEYNLYQMFASSISTAQQSIAPVLNRLCLFYGLYGLVENSGDFFVTGSLTNEAHLRSIEHELELCLTQLRPDLVSLVDAFDLPDRAVNSILGRYDGQVYDRLLEWAQNSPLNRVEVLPMYHSSLRPLMKGKDSPASQKAKL